MKRMKSKMDRFCWYFTQRRLIFLIFILIITAIFAAGILKIKSAVVLSELFPYNHPYVKLQARFAQVFGGGGTTAIIVVRAKHGDIFNEKTLTSVKQITDEILLWDEIYRFLTTSLATHSTKVVTTKALGEISVEPLMYPYVPKTGKDMDLLRKNLFSSPAYEGILVSQDGSAALVMTEFKENISYARAFGKLNSIVARYTDDNTDIHVVGFPMLMGYIYNLKPQMRLVFVSSIVLITLILYWIFRNFTGMVAPLAMGAISTAFGLGFVGWMQINFSPLLYVLAFLVGARIISHAVQITHRYFEELHETGTNDKQMACFKTMRAMIMPNVAGVTTDAAGFTVLILARIVLMQHIAVIMTFWMISILFSAILTPIICTFVPLRSLGAKYSKQKRKALEKPSLLDKINIELAKFSMGRGRYAVIFLVLGIMIFSVWQSTRLKIGDTSAGSPLLWPDHKYNEDQAVINKLFKASSETFSLYYDGEPGSVIGPDVFPTFEKFATHMEKELGDIFKSSSSLVDLMKMLNTTLHDGDPLWYKLPRNPELMSGIYQQVRAKAGSAALFRYVDADLERAQLTLYFADHTSDNLVRIKKAAFDFFETHPLRTEKGEFKLAGGSVGLNIGLNEEMKDTHVYIDTMVLIAIFVMCSVCFRSFLAGVMLTIPLLVANMGAFAYMCLMDIGLSVNTLPVAAVGVGVGVDFAIYLYSRVVEEFPRQDGDWSRTITVSVATCGKAIIFTATTIIIAIIPWYFLSELKFQAEMGFFLAMLLFINMILAMTLHPLMIMLVKPEFVKGKCKNNKKAFKIKMNQIKQNMFTSFLKGFLVLCLLVLPLCASMGKVCHAESGKIHYQDLFSVNFPTQMHGWACGKWGTILNTNDGGQTWRTQNSGTDYDLTEIFFANEKSGWAVGEEGIIIKTDDGGKTWNVQSCPVDYFLMGSFFWDDKTGWIVGEHTTILHTNNGGKDWRIALEDEDFILKKISFCDRRTGWAVGEYGCIYNTTDGGSTWEKQAGGFEVSDFTGEIKGGTYLFDVKSIDALSAMAVGIGGYVTETRNGGKTWREMDTNLPNTHLLSITGENNESLIVAGIGGIYKASGENMNFKESVASPPVIYGWIYDVARINSKKYAAVGRNGAVYLSEDKGKSWRKVS